MFERVTLEEVIRESGAVSNASLASTGWHELKCPVCNDYRVRAGFLFDPGGSVAYHCFNCAHVAVFRPDQIQFSKKMTTVLEALGVDMQRAKRALFHAFGAAVQPKFTPEEKELMGAPVIQLPDVFVPINSSIHTRAVEYINSRGLTVDGFNWHVASSKAEWRWRGRIILPVTNNRGHVVFYQGRSFTGSGKRWESPPIPKTNLLFNHSAVYGASESIIVCEGMMDALSVTDGVAILGSSFSPYQIAELNKFRGKKIVVPNKDSNGQYMAKQALASGFSLSFPDIGTCDDLNSALVRYGSLYLENQIHKNICTGVAAEMRLSIWCNV